MQEASCAAASRLCRHSAQTPTPYNASVLSRVSMVELICPSLCYLQSLSPGSAEVGKMFVNESCVSNLIRLTAALEKKAEKMGK